ncbi:hypothetical protein [Shewanella gaetbuli]|uniref:OmpR/PhoB-type domain-containing protein n=1 Tax=Shewanella gaetbuli TaxID=220752 RepID=A0A9X2CFC9_9GAMM|nr:hypothetical protein [Shewanella gaetbuli]MCL1141273.1 hypothetical protein [Shewanella gaetbuli]
MQIGRCWFDQQKKQLIDQSTEQIWSLNEHEFAVLAQLVFHRGRVVSLEQLSPIKITNEELTHVVESICRYLGEQHKSLIEYVPEQGIILHKKVISHPFRLLDSPKRAISYGNYILILILTVLAMTFVYSNLSYPTNTKPNFARQILSTQGNITHLLVYGNKQNNDSLRRKTEAISRHLRRCNILPWQSITVAFSEDNLNLSVVMKRKNSDGWEFNNAKLILPNLDHYHVHSDWYKEVSICA